MVDNLAEKVESVHYLKIRVVEYCLCTIESLKSVRHKE